MTRQPWFLAAAIVGVVYALAAANQALSQAPDPLPKRTAVVVDTSGTETEVTDFKFAIIEDYLVTSSRHAVWTILTFPYTHAPRIALQTKTFLVVIPLDCLNSLEATDNEVKVPYNKQTTSKEPITRVWTSKEYEAKYVWMGKERRIQGALCCGNISGTSDLGNIALPANNLKKLTLKPARTPGQNEKSPILEWRKTYAKWARDMNFWIGRHSSQDEKSPSHEGALVDAEGMNVRFWQIKRLEGGTFGHVCLCDDLPFFRGDVLVSVQLKNISTIEFGDKIGDKIGDKNSVTVTMTTGTKVTGTLAKGGVPDALGGFRGVSENGFFYTSPDHVKSIRFGSQPEPGVPALIRVPKK